MRNLVKRVIICFSILFLVLIFPRIALAANYGEGNYGDGLYGEGQSNSSSSGSSGSSGSTSSYCGGTKPGSAPDLFQINPKATSVTLYFAPSLNPRNGYTVSYGTDPNAEQFAFSFPHDSSGVIAVDVNALATNTVYYFKARAMNGCVAGDWSNILSARTGQRFPVYRWSSILKIITKTLNPSSVTKVNTNNTQVVPATVVQPPTQTTTPTQQTSPNIFQQIGNFFRGLFGG